MFCDPKCGPGGTHCRGRCQRSSLGCLVRCFYVCPWKILFKHTRFVYSKSKGQRSSETGLVRARRATSMVSCPPPPKLCPWSTFVVLETLVVAGTTHHIRSFGYFARCLYVSLSAFRQQEIAWRLVWPRVIIQWSLLCSYGSECENVDGCDPPRKMVFGINLTTFFNMMMLCFWPSGVCKFNVHKFLASCRKHLALYLLYSPTATLTSLPYMATVEHRRAVCCVSKPTFFD